MRNKIDISTIVKQNIDEVVSATVDKEVILLSVEQGLYYNMKLTGSHIWNLIKRPVSAKNICQTLSCEFNVDEQTCQKDVLSYLNQLLDEQLITIVS